MYNGEVSASEVIKIISRQACTKTRTRSRSRAGLHTSFYIFIEESGPAKEDPTRWGDQSKKRRHSETFGPEEQSEQYNAYYIQSNYTAVYAVYKQYVQPNRECYKFQRTQPRQTHVSFKQKRIENHIWQLANRNPGFSIRIVGINTRRKTYAKQNVLSFSQSTRACIKRNSQSRSRQLMRPIWRVETMVLPLHIGIFDHAVSGIADCNRRKDI